MATRIGPLLTPRDLRYDHAELLEGGAQFCCFETLAELSAYWSSNRAVMSYACVGTGSASPCRFLDRHEWVFAPTREALISAAVRWDEFGIAFRWHDFMSDARSVSRGFQEKRESRRDLRRALGTWSQADEAAYASNFHPVRPANRSGFWRLTNLPGHLTHFDWFSEYARMPSDPDLPREVVSVLLRQLTYDDWKLHQTLDDVAVMDAAGVDEEIAYWRTELACGRPSYDD